MSGKARHSYAGLAVVLLALLPPPDPQEAHGPVAMQDARPAQRRDHFAYGVDPIRRRVVVQGGNIGQEWLNSAWEWDGSAWREIAATPPPRSSHVMAPDPGGNGVLLYGGVRDGGALFGDSWLWNGDRWTEVVGPGPSPRYSPAIGFDEQRRRVVLFSGCGPGPDTLWEWDGASWIETTSETPEPSSRCRATMAYDPKRKALLLFGGYGGGDVLGDTWSWDGRRWERLDVAGPPARANQAMALDPTRGRIVLFGGWAGRNATGAEHYDDTWEWDGQAWTRIDVAGPPSREVAGMVFDPVLRKLLLLGGRGADGRTLGDMWTFDGAVWREITP